MPLINQHKGNGFEDITMKKIRNFNKFHTNIPTITTTNLPVVEGEGLFSGLSSLISSGANFIKANSEVIKTVGSAGANVAGASKNIVNAVNSTKKLNAEIEQLKKIKEYRVKLALQDRNNRQLSKTAPAGARTKEKEQVITYTPTETNKPLTAGTNKSIKSATTKCNRKFSKKFIKKEIRKRIKNLLNENFSLKNTKC